MYIGTRHSCRILIKIKFSRRFFEKYSLPDFMKILPVGVELIHADRRKDSRAEMDIHDDANSVFCNFANAPKKC
jgi:hypothetical protein